MTKLRILIIHNTYLHTGGEDMVVKNESALLAEQNEVKTIIYDNAGFSSGSIFALLGIFFNFKTFFQIRNEIKTFQPDIIHIHNLFYTLSPSVIFAARSKKVPLLMTVHNFRLICVGALLLRNNAICELCINSKFPLSGIKYKCFQKSYFKSALLTSMVSLHNLLGTWKKKVSAYIVLTPFIKDKLIHSTLNLNEKSVFIKPNYTQDYGFTSISSREPFYLYVGRLSTEKGIQVALEAWAGLNKKLIIIGDGPLKNLVIAHQEKNQNIQYLGHKTSLEVNAYMKKALAVLIPSICYEGMPMTIIESFSTGTPVICSDNNNLRSIVTNELNGKFFTAGSSEDLRKVITTFSFNSSHYINARETYLKMFTKEASYERLIQIYNKVITENSKN